MNDVWSTATHLGPKIVWQAHTGRVVPVRADVALNHVATGLWHMSLAGESVINGRPGLSFERWGNVVDSPCSSQGRRRDRFVFVDGIPAGAQCPVLQCGKRRQWRIRHSRYSHIVIALGQHSLLDYVRPVITLYQLGHKR